MSRVDNAANMAMVADLSRKIYVLDDKVTRLATMMCEYMDKIAEIKAGETVKNHTQTSELIQAVRNEFHNDKIRSVIEFHNDKIRAVIESKLDDVKHTNENGYDKDNSKVMDLNQAVELLDKSLKEVDNAIADIAKKLKKLSCEYSEMDQLMFPFNLYTPYAVGLAFANLLIVRGKDYKSEYNSWLFNQGCQGLRNVTVQDYTGEAARLGAENLRANAVSRAVKFGTGIVLGAAAVDTALHLYGLYSANRTASDRENPSSHESGAAAAPGIAPAT